MISVAKYVGRVSYELNIAGSASGVQVVDEGGDWLFIEQQDLESVIKILQEYKRVLDLAVAIP